MKFIVSSHDNFFIFGLMLESCILVLGAAFSQFLFCFLQYNTRINSLKFVVANGMLNANFATVGIL